MQTGFDGQKHMQFLVDFTLVEAPYFGWHKHQRCIVAKYNDYGHLLYAVILQPYKLNIHI